MGKKCGRFFKKDFHTFCLSFVQLCNSWFQSPTGWWAQWAQARFARHNWAQCGKNAIPVLFYALIWHFIPTFQISPQIFHSPIFLQHFLPYFPVSSSRLTELQIRLGLAAAEKIPLKREERVASLGLFLESATTYAEQICWAFEIQIFPA